MESGHAALIKRTQALPWLWDKRVQRVDGPARDSLSLTFFDRGDKFSLVLMFGTTTRGLGARRERPKGDAASSFIQRLRTQIEGARLSSAEWLCTTQDEPASHAQALLLSFTRAEHSARIAIDFDAAAPNLLLLREDATVAGASDERARRLRFPDKTQPFAPGQGRGIAIVASPDALFAAGETLLQSNADKREDSARAHAIGKVRSALKKVQRKVTAIHGDLARADAAPRLRREAQLLLCHLASIPRGATSARLLDENVEPPEWLELVLDPALPAQQLAQQRFDRARKVERGVGIASARLLEAEREADALTHLLARLEHEPVDALAQLSELRGVALTRAKSSKNKPQQRVPYRVFLADDGHKILVGKGAADNDTLTLTVARSHDHWLHVRGIPGSHVVVPLERKVVIGQELLLDAAHLAAHFSKQRGEPTVEIAHTERRFVRKPKGAAPGSVNVDRERVFVLRIEPTRLARLLASERN